MSGADRELHRGEGLGQDTVQGVLLETDRQTRLKTLPSPFRWEAVTMGLLGHLTLFEEDCCGSSVMRIHSVTATPTYIEPSLIHKLWRDNE